MKNKIIVDQNENKEEYHILFKVETDKEDINYIVYTNGEKTRDGEEIAYAASYSKINGKQVLEPIEEEYILEFLDSVLLQAQSKMNKEVGE